MPLDLNTTGGDFTPYIAYNAKAGRWAYKVDGQDQLVDVPLERMVAVWDLENLKTGWVIYKPNSAPEKIYDEAAGVRGPKPDGDGWKHGIEVLLFSSKNLDGEKELTTTAVAALRPFSALYDTYEAAPEKAKGQLPVVHCARTVPVTSKYGTNYEPELKIVAWVDRKDTPWTDAAKLAASTPTQTSQPPAAPATPAAATPPPAQQTNQGAPDF
ncbi:MAG: hypothetical protein AAF562_10065 [Pseudomonadota bacterium]